MTTTVESLDNKIAQLKARRAAKVARERTRERKRDTRCKILLGAGLLSLVNGGDADATAVYRRIRATLVQRDAKAFDGWAGEPKQSTEDSI